MKKTIFAGAVLAFSLLSVPALANVISLNPVTGNLYQQTVQSPCVFSNPSCSQPAGWLDTALPTGGAITSYDAVSPVYTVAQIFSIIGAGSPLRLGLDINQASEQPAQTLSLFTMLVNGVVVDAFLFAGTGNVPAGNNGNGYADYLLADFHDLTSFAATDTIQFHFVFNNANDDTENVFLIGAPRTTVPEPGTLALFGIGLVGLALIHRRKGRKA